MAKSMTKDEEIQTNSNKYCVKLKKFKCKFVGIRITNVQSSGDPQKRKPVFMRRKHLWFVESMWAENPTTIQTWISKETKRFSRMEISSLANESARNITSMIKDSHRRSSPRYPQQK